LSALRLDVDRARSALKRQVARAPVQLAEGFATVVRSAPEGRLEQLLRTPIRRPVLEGIFWQMPQHINRKAAAGMKATVRWRITHGSDQEADVYDLQIDDGRCRVRRGEGEREPKVTIILDAAEFIRVATANSDPMQAYFKGRIKLEGDIMVAARVQALFRLPGANKPAQSSSTVSSSR
jgi:putative sterol carrier protein